MRAKHNDDLLNTSTSSGVRISYSTHPFSKHNARMIHNDEPTNYSVIWPMHRYEVTLTRSGLGTQHLRQNFPGAKRSSLSRFADINASVKSISLFSS